MTARVLSGASPRTMVGMSNQSGWGCRVVVHRSSGLTTVADNYDRLHYPPQGVARDARYTRYVTPTTMLRTHTSAEIPPLLRVLAASHIDDVLLVCPGLVYRRDSIDRLHTGEPHQVDLWRLRSDPPPLGVDDQHRGVRHGLKKCRIRISKKFRRSFGGVSEPVRFAFGSSSERRAGAGLKKKRAGRRVSERSG